MLGGEPHPEDQPSGLVSQVRKPRSNKEVLRPAQLGTWTPASSPPLCPRLIVGRHTARRQKGTHTSHTNKTQCKTSKQQQHHILMSISTCALISSSVQNPWCILTVTFDCYWLPPNSYKRLITSFLGSGSFLGLILNLPHTWPLVRNAESTQDPWVRGCMLKIEKYIFR